MKNQHNKGFTLIELLVVISIISFIASFLLAALNDARKRSRDTGKVSSFQEVRNALQIFLAEKGYYPASANLTSDLVNNKFITSIDSGLIYVGLPINCTEGACSSYHLGIVLEDSNNKVLGGDKDTTDGFIGNSTDCAGTSGTDRCYDVEP